MFFLNQHIRNASKICQHRPNRLPLIKFHLYNSNFFMPPIFNLYFSPLKILSIIITVLFSVFQFSCQRKGTDIAWIERIDPELNTIISASVNIEVIAEGFDCSEGPLWLSQKQVLLFSDIP